MAFEDEEIQQQELSQNINDNDNSNTDPADNNNNNNPVDNTPPHIQVQLCWQLKNYCNL